MKRFNPNRKDILSFAEALDPIICITDEEEAAQYFKDYVEYLRNHTYGKVGVKDPEETALINIGYYAGYFDRETQERVNRLFKTSHPIFGDKPVRAEEAFEMGRKLAQQTIDNDKEIL